MLSFKALAIKEEKKRMNRIKKQYEKFRKCSFKLVEKSNGSIDLWIIPPGKEKSFEAKNSQSEIWFIRYCINYRL